METQSAEASSLATRQEVVRNVLAVDPRNTVGSSWTALDLGTDGFRFKAKVIGVDPVPCAAGEKMCWDSMMKLKGIEEATRKQGKHKQRIWLKVLPTGLRLYDWRSGVLQHEHEWSRISSLTKDQSDPRALAYVFQQREQSYCLFYIKMGTPADPVLEVMKQVRVTREGGQDRTDAQTLALLPLETSDPEHVLSPDSTPNQPEHSTLRTELMQVFSVPLPDPMTPSETTNPVENPPVCPEPELPPQPMLSNNQILSMFTPHAVRGASPYPPANMPWGQQWAGGPGAPWPAVPGAVAGWAPPSVVAPQSQPQSGGAASYPAAPPTGAASTQATVNQNLLL